MNNLKKFTLFSIVFLHFFTNTMQLEENINPLEITKNDIENQTNSDITINIEPALKSEKKKDISEQNFEIEVPKLEIKGDIVKIPLVDNKTWSGTLDPKDKNYILYIVNNQPKFKDEILTNYGITYSKNKIGLIKKATLNPAEIIKTLHPEATIKMVNILPSEMLKSFLLLKPTTEIEVENKVHVKLIAYFNFLFHHNTVVDDKPYKNICQKLNNTIALNRFVPATEDILNNLNVKFINNLNSLQDIEELKKSPEKSDRLAKKIIEDAKQSGFYWFLLYMNNFLTTISEIATEKTSQDFTDEEKIIIRKKILNILNEDFCKNFLNERKIKELKNKLIPWYKKPKSLIIGGGVFALIIAAILHKRYGLQNIPTIIRNYFKK